MVLEEGAEDLEQASGDVEVVQVEHGDAHAGHTTKEEEEDKRLLIGRAHDGRSGRASRGDVPSAEGNDTGVGPDLLLPAKGEILQVEDLALHQGQPVVALLHGLGTDDQLLSGMEPGVSD